MKSKILSLSNIKPEERIIVISQIHNAYPNIFEIFLWGSIDKDKTITGEEFHPTRLGLICLN